MPLHLSLLLAVAALTRFAYAVDFQVGSTGGTPVSPLQYGLFFEDINQSGDGGIYAELLSNRAFQGTDPKAVNTAPWYPNGGAQLHLVVDDASPISPAIPFSASVSGGSGQVGLSQNGFWGIDVRPQTYSGSFYMKGSYRGQVTASLHSNGTDATPFGSAKINVDLDASQGWQPFPYTLEVTTAAPNVNNSFTLSWDSTGVTAPIQLSLISLFPPTYNNRPNGMRMDLMENLKKLSPSFLRFPGGNNLEGNSAGNTRWRWNETIGPLKDRPGRFGSWNYFQSDGLGLDEYFHWCEDLDMDAILAVWDGLYLDRVTISEGELDPYIQDALNELEYILGDESTTYGGLRCTNGHPEPYKLQYVEIGNEDNLNDGFDSYAQYRYRMFRDAIKQKYPQLNIIASTYSLDQDAFGPGAAGDYHQYGVPDQLVSQSDFFDLNTTDHQILIGEVANVQPNKPSMVAFPNGSFPSVNFTQNSRNPFWIGSVAEAVFSLGAERNAAKILGNAFAPLFENLNSYQWTPNMIPFSADPADTILSTSYQVWQLLGGTRFTQTRTANVTDQPGHQGPAQSPSDGPVFWAAGSNTVTGADIIKLAVYNASVTTPPTPSAPAATGSNQQGSGVPVTVTFDGVNGGTQAQLTVLSATDPMAEVATAGQNPVISSVRTITSNPEGRFDFSLPDLSVAVLETRPQTGAYGSQGGSGGYGGCKHGAPRGSYDWQAWLAGRKEGTGCYMS